MYALFTGSRPEGHGIGQPGGQAVTPQVHRHEHILLGLILEGAGVAANVLRDMGIDRSKVRQEVEKLVQSGEESVFTMGNLPMTPRSKRVVAFALEEARNLNHNYVGTEHILLGLLREQEGVAAQILMNLGLKLDEVRDEIKSLFGHGLSEGGRTVAKTPEPLPEPPAVCPKCGQPRVVRVLWNWVHLWGQKEEDVRLGKAILAARDNAGGPPWVCLQCAPGLVEVHRLAMQEWQWQLAKEAAVAATQFEKAAWYRDSQDELWQRMMAVVKELGGQWGQT